MTHKSQHHSAPQPVAYDIDGRPLYHHPPVVAHQPQNAPEPHPDTTPTPHSHVTAVPNEHAGHNFNPKLRTQHANEPKVVHAARPHEPQVPQMSEKLRKKHEESKRLYPFLNLSEGEFVMLRIRRHPIGLFLPVVGTAIVLIMLLSAAFLYPDMYAASPGALPDPQPIVLGLLLASFLVLCGGGVAIWVYLQNQFFLTNESVIQEIQHGLFSRHEQTVSLGSIEDASFKQYGLLPTLFNYGIIRLSTEGEETTYRFNYVEDPKRQVAIVNNAVENFKNGRPVGEEYL